MELVGISKICSAKLRKTGSSGIRLVVMIMGLFALIAAMLLTSCAFTATSEVEEEVRTKVVSSLTAIKDTTLKELGAEISRIDQEVSALNSQLNKLNQVATPALETIQALKADAEKAGYGGKRTLEAAGYLESDQFRNDQFRVVKLQFTSELLSGSTKYTSVILVEDLITGRVSPMEELRSELEGKISALTQQRNTKKKAYDFAAATADAVLSQYQDWEIVKVNATTYNVSGPGLGMAQGLTTGVWTYYLEPERLVSSDAASSVLLKVLMGKQ